jgi:hypothetical protein
MGIFGKRRTYTVPTDWPDAANLGLGAGLDVVGITHHADAFRKVHQPNKVLRTVAVLVPKPKNEHDSNAVAVHISGHKVGHLSRADAVTYRQRIDQAVDAYGYAAVWADVEGGGYRTVTLEPQSLGAMSRAAIAKVLDAAGFVTANHDEGTAGYSMRYEDGRYRVFWSGAGGAEREDNVPSMAKALRDAGYKARTTHDDGYAAVSVSGVK